eukprot:1207436-Heterocapsa_arctica.AAC.1
MQPGGQTPGCIRARILLRAGLPRVGTLGLLTPTLRRARGIPVWWSIGGVKGCPGSTKETYGVHQGRSQVTHP